MLKFHILNSNGLLPISFDTKEEAEKYAKEGGFAPCFIAQIISLVQ